MVERTRKRSSGYLFFIFLFWVLNHQLMFLVEARQSLVAGLCVIDLAMLCGMGFFFWVVLSNIFHLHNDLKFKLEAIFSVILVLTSAYAAHKTFGQPWSMGILPSRAMVTSWFMYLAIGILLKNGLITLQELKKTFYLFCKIYLAEAFIQLVVGSVIIFVHVLVNERNGLRYYLEDSSIMLFAGLQLNDFLHETDKKKKYYSLIWMFVSVLFLVGITKSRMAMIELILALGFGYVITADKLENKLFQCFLVLIAAVGLFQTSTVQEAIYDANNFGEEGSTTEVRAIGLEFYKKIIKEHPLLGFGLVNMNWEPAVEGSGMNRNIFMVDNGMYGVAVYYGLIGVMWGVIITVKSGWLCYKLYKLNGNVAYMCYLLTTIIGIKTLVPNFYEEYFAYQLYLVMLECEYAEQRKLAEENKSDTVSDDNGMYIEEYGTA